MEALDNATLDRLDEIHAQQRIQTDRPSYDGLYPRWEHLSGPHGEVSKALGAGRRACLRTRREAAGKRSWLPTSQARDARLLIQS